MASRAHIVSAPARPKDNARLQKSIFLAGTTSQTAEGDWREALTQNLTGFPITIFNPKRDDWDSSWTEDGSDSRWVEQVEWELEMQERADLVVVFFHDTSVAPISLLELGLCVRSGKAVVCALDGYSKKGNVMAVCSRYAADFVATLEDLTHAVRARLEREGVYEADVES